MLNSWVFFCDVVTKARRDSVECLWEDYWQRRKQLELWRSRERQVNGPPAWLPRTHGGFLTTSERCTGLEGATKVPDPQLLTIGRTAGQTASSPALDGPLPAVLHSPRCSSRWASGLGRAAGQPGEGPANPPVGARPGAS